MFLELLEFLSEDIVLLFAVGVHLLEFSALFERIFYFLFVVGFFHFPVDPCLPVFVEFKDFKLLLEFIPFLG